MTMALFLPFFFSFFLLFLFSSSSAEQPKAFIHIGPHKTGTSSIQETMVENSNLARTQGFYFLPAKEQKEAADLASSFVASSRSQPQQFMTDFSNQKILLNQPSNENENENEILNLVISSERFDLMPNKEAVQQLQNFFCDYNVTIVAFLRNPIDLLQSYWLQGACFKKVTPVLSLPEYLQMEAEKVLAGGGESGEELLRVLDMYMEVFGKESIVLVDFDGVLQHGKSFAGVFLEEIVGMNNVQNKRRHINSKARFVNPLNVWSTVDRQSPPTFNYLSTIQDSLIPKLGKHGLLETCDRRINFQNISRQLDLYFEEGLKVRGLEVMYRRVTQPPMKGKKECVVVTTRGEGTARKLYNEMRQQQRDVTNSIAHRRIFRG